MGDAECIGAGETGVTRLLNFTGAHCESVEIQQDFEYTTVSDYLSHLGSYSCKAEGRIQDVSVKSHQDERHLNEHTDKHPAGRFRFHRNYPGSSSPSIRITYEVPLDSMVHRDGAILSINRL
jgi:hypothetical protein